MKRIFIFALIALVSATSISAQKKAKKTKTTKAAAVVEPVAVAPDTVSVDRFSYALGFANSNGLTRYLSQRLGIDTLQNMADFIRGFRDMTDANSPALKAYSAGLQIGDQVLNQMLPNVNKQITDNPDSAFVNKNEFIRGFLAAVNMSDPTLTADSAMKIADTQLEFYHAQLMEKKYGDNRREGEAFLVANAKKDSVVTLPSGLQYKILKQGTGEKPGPNSKVEVNYEGRLIDGTVFDSSYKRNKPQEFGVGGVIPGFSEALQLMPTGSEWEIYIPQQLGYGDRENPNSPIKPYSTLIFRVELLSVKAAPAPKVPAVKK
ncbi:MAG: FKBP-type peptidyl-prolyl cis-trans isomerase [Bacteroidaceae bacterium]|nr:FKBP-type peptidyl-prolyl cis-trans isomerase [Bacteroidaceae bacterium]MBO4593152.1 FKBP-type peptidyl-prolyl cis-trans isomerase [Bacteroidaceae bacterium]MBR4131085.1 FKBP-type peptidyl-prolyl cis-trans isomerase [Bacteroidaceae bacterium]